MFCFILLCTAFSASSFSADTLSNEKTIQPLFSGRIVDDCNIVQLHNQNQHTAEHLYDRGKQLQNATHPFQTTIYVDDNNTEGPWNGTSEHPYQTIQDGIDNAQDFDTVFVRNGTYYENVDVHRPLTLLGESRESTIIDAGGSGHVIRVSRPEGNGSIQHFTLQHSGSYENPFGPSDSGIAVYSADPVYNQFVFDNTLKENYVGLSIYTASNNFIASNSFEHNEIGLHIAPSFGYSQYNTVIENTFSDNTVGVLLETPDSNSIFHNNFKRNKEHAEDEYVNTWDDESGMGNYWDSYNGSDADGDGIGEQVYDIPGAAHNKDRYPLLYPLDQENQLVGLWHMDAGSDRWVYDSSWNYNHGTCKTPVWSEGISDDGLLFNGSSDYVRINDSDSLRVTDSFTTSAWVKTTRVYNESEPDHQMVIAKQYEPNNRSFSLALFEDLPRFRIFDRNDTMYSVLADIPLNNSEWYHLTGVYDNQTGTLSVYVNGLLDNQSMIDQHPPQYRVLDVFIGANQTNQTGKESDNHFKGYIDEVSLYQRALSESDVWELYKKDAPLQLRGSCFYDQSQTQPVDNLSVRVKNINTNVSWQACIQNNTYRLSLRRIDDVCIGDTLRYIAKDNSSFVNVTDHVITEQDVDQGTIILDFILDEYFRDLVDFPMYHAEINNSCYSTLQLCGAATLQMNLNYVWWNQSIHDRPPNTFANQTWLFETARANNSNTSLPYIDADGMHHTLETQSPGPYEDYGYHFAVKHSTDGDEILAQICQWIDYPAGIKPGHPLHVPACTPTFGTYSRWMSIRGIHTNTSAYPPHEALNIHGFWINDPYPSGIGEKTYKTAEEWRQTYFCPLNVTDDPYRGEYVAIVEPPLTPTQNISLSASPARFNTSTPLARPFRSTLSPHFFHLISDALIIKAATKGVCDQLLPYSEEAQAIFERSYPTKPLFVEHLVDEKQNYYLISFTKTPNGFQRRNDHTQPEQQNTVFVVRIAASDGHFQEASWSSTPVSYLTYASEAQVRPLVLQKLEHMGYNPNEIRHRAIDIDCVYRKQSPYYPEWQITINALDMTLYLNQQGEFT